MFGIVFVSLLLIMGPLALLGGVDSRLDDVARRRRYND